MENNQAKFQNEKSGRVIIPEYIECHGVWNYPIYEEDRLVGRALLIVPVYTTEIEKTYAIPEMPTVLFDTTVYEEKDRRKGIADDLMSLVTSTINNIITFTLSKAGRNLGFKHGFKLKKSKGHPDILHYYKEEEDGESTPDK